jgi:hypothetical protein
VRLSAVTRALSRHCLSELVIVLVAMLTGLGLGVLLAERGSTALAPNAEPLPSETSAEPLGSVPRDRGGSVPPQWDRSGGPASSAHGLPADGH